MKTCKAMAKYSRAELAWQKEVRLRYNTQFGMVPSDMHWAGLDMEFLHNLRYNDDITNYHVRRILDTSKRLTHINLSYTNKPERWFQHLPKVTDIDLVGCHVHERL